MARTRSSKSLASASPNCDDDGEWVGQAWVLWCQGERNWTALGKRFGKHRITVRNALRKYATARAAEVGDIDPTAEYVDGLEGDLQRALEAYEQLPNPNAKVGALNLAAKIRERIAAAKGVATQRQAHEVSGPGGGPVQHTLAVSLEQLADPETRALAADLAARLAAGQVEPDAGTDPDGADAGG